MSEQNNRTSDSARRELEQTAAEHDTAPGSLVKKDALTDMASERARAVLASNEEHEGLPEQAEHALAESWTDGFVLGLRYQLSRTSQASTDQRVARLRRLESYRADYLRKRDMESASDMAHQIAALAAELDAALCGGAPLPREWKHGSQN